MLNIRFGAGVATFVGSGSIKMMRLLTAPAHALQHCCQGCKKKHMNIFDIVYEEAQFDKYMEGEGRIRRDTPMPDTRVHACLYFIAPTGHACLLPNAYTPLSLYYLENVLCGLHQHPGHGGFSLTVAYCIPIFHNTVQFWEVFGATVRKCCPMAWTTEQRTSIERGYLFLPGSSMGVL
jgi:Septin